MANVNRVGLRREPESQWLSHKDVTPCRGCSRHLRPGLVRLGRGNPGSPSLFPMPISFVIRLVSSRHYFSRQIRNTGLSLRKPSYRAVLCRQTLGESSYKPDSSPPPRPVLPSSSQQLLILNKTIHDQQQLSMARRKSGSKELTSASVHSKR